MGVKPFFYYARNGFFAFASEKKGLLCLPEVDQTVSRQYFYNHVFPSHIQAAGTTLYEHIHRLAPAHSLSYYPQKNNFQLHNYWTLDVYTELKLARKEDYYDGLRQHFEEAVRCRVRSNYDVGAELSGGMDSSSITGVAANLMAGGSRKLTTFTNADSAESLSITAERGLSEQQYVNDVVQFNKISDAVLVSENISDDPIVIADLLLQINDGLERWNLSWQIPIKQKAGSRNIRTILSGFPGDEMVTYRGEHFFLDYLDQKKYSAYFRAASKYPFKKVKPFLPPGLEFLVHKALNIAAFTGRPIKGATDFVPIPLKYRLTMGDVAWQDPSYRERYKSFRHFQRYRLLKPQVPLRMETETHLGTWYRLEPRFPMADIRLTQFYLSMPNALKYEGATSRWTWRQAVKRYLPDSVANRDSKIGALVPYAISPQDQQRRVEAIRKLITTSDKIFKHAKIKHVIGLEGKNSSVKNIMLLRWLEKNFENL
jgi:asparagine synthase (glutamine-hydrolysing)